MVNISKGTLKLELSPDKEWVEIFNKGSQAITSVCEKGLKIYGITTGFGDSVDRDVSVEKATQLQYNLAKYHGCGLGNKLSPLLARAVMVCRLASLKTGSQESESVFWKELSNCSKRILYRLSLRKDR